MNRFGLRSLIITVPILGWISVPGSGFESVSMQFKYTIITSHEKNGWQRWPWDYTIITSHENNGWQRWSWDFMCSPPPHRHSDTQDQDTLMYLLNVPKDLPYCRWGFLTKSTILIFILKYNTFVLVLRCINNELKTTCELEHNVFSQSPNVFPRLYTWCIRFPKAHF